MMKNKYNQWILVSATALTLTACGSSGNGTSDGGSENDGGTNEPAKPTQNSIVHNGTLYGTVVSPTTGRVWLDRNLGADRVCTGSNDEACYGDVYQWGRDYDGHQDRHSEITYTQETSLEETSHKFVAQKNRTGSKRNSLEVRDWFTAFGKQSKLSEQREERVGTVQEKADYEVIKAYAKKRQAIWSRTDGSSICPVGFRVPNHLEMGNEGLANTDNADKRFHSFLKLPNGALSRVYNGEYYDLSGLSDLGASNYWSTSISYRGATVGIMPKVAIGGHYIYAAQALPIRCIKGK